MTDLKNKVVLITGGSNGYGKAACNRFFSQGAKVIITGRDEVKLQRTQKEIGGIDYIAADAAKADDWDKVYRYIEERYGRLDILVNNAGGGVSIVDTVDQTIADIDKSIALNLSSVIYGSRYFGEMMKTQKQGTIINISSVCAKQAWPGFSVYAAAKWGVLGFSKGLYVELRPYNIRVTCLIPGAGNTGFRKNANMPEFPAKLEAEDVAQAIVDICKLPEHVVVEEVVLWGIDQEVIPL